MTVVKSVKRATKRQKWRMMVSRLMEEGDRSSNRSVFPKG